MPQFSQRGRLLLAGLALICLAGVAVAIYIVSHRALNASSMVAFLPERDASFFYADIRAVRSSGILNKLVGSAVAEESEYKAFVAQTGFDYKRDLDQVVGSSGDGSSYFLLEGRFDWPRLAGHVKQQGGTCKGDGDCFVKGSTPERIISFRRLRSNLMALASSPSDTGAHAVEERPSQQAVSTIPVEPVWISLPGSAIRTQRAMPPGTKLFAKALENANRVLIKLGPQGADFALAMDIMCPGEEDATVLKQQLDSLTKLLQSLIAREQKTPNRNDLSGILTSGVFERERDHVQAKWMLPRAFLETLGGGQ